MKSLQNPRNKKILWGLLISATYPAVVLSYVWYHCFISNFQGGKNGQLDAYRHTLASAVVAYTSSPKVVSVFTAVTEFGDEADNLMDRHNNSLGAELGYQAEVFAHINPRVIQQVNNGIENSTNGKQITWLPKSFWGKSLFW
ncbi:hypothetical protein [Methyloglobulus sp.]|uniref:hypothetical protein n=1 Tax=Methyloglobulus sp. TaxID=2518622 RepID=UPI0032B74099